MNLFSKKKLPLILSILFLISFTAGLSLSTYPVIEDETLDLSDEIADISEEVEEIGEQNLNFEKYLVEIDTSLYQPEMIEALGGEVRHEYDSMDVIAVEIPEIAVEQLENLNFVQDIEKDRITEIEPPIVTQSEEYESEQETSDNMDGDSVRIAVLDTGIDNSHQDFGNRIIDNQDFTGDGAEDVQGHGTHVAGIAAGDGDYPGVANEALLKNIKVLDNDGQGRASDIIAGIDYSIDKQVDVMVLSLGAEIDRCDGTDMISRSVDNAVEAGILTAVSAGNSGSDSQTITTPGCSEKGFTVGATNYNNDGIADFSSRGLTADERIKPDISAPGTAIMAAEAGTEDGYVMKSGTSMSAPFVAGAFALMIGQNDGLEVEDYYDAVLDTATDLGKDQSAQGMGKINKTASINQISLSETTDEDEATEEEHTEGESETVEENTEDSEVDRETSETEESQNEQDENSFEEESEADEATLNRLSKFLQDLIAFLRF